MNWEWVPIVAMLITVGGLILANLRANRAAQRAEYMSLIENLTSIQEHVAMINGTVRGHTSSIVKIETIMEERLRVGDIERVKTRTT